MEQAPLQIYYSALVFTPMKSIVRKQFDNGVLRWMQRLPDVQKDWGVLLQTLEGHSAAVTAVTFSPDGKYLASASADTTVRLYDVAKEEALQVFEGHSHEVYVVAFSPDGKQLVSGSFDNAVRVWDVTTGGILQILEGHSDNVRAVVFSPNGKQLASCADDNKVRIWDAASGATLQILDVHVDVFCCTLSFSSDGSYLMTNRGRLDAISLHSNTVPSSLPLPLARPVVFPHTIFVQDEWIIRGTDRMLWLPPDYRPTCSAVHDSVVCLGHRSGRVSIFHFTF
jgi:WD40 repeat protein